MSSLKELKKWRCQKSQKLPMLPALKTHSKMLWHLQQLNKRLAPEQRRKRLMRKKVVQQREEPHLRRKAMYRLHPKMERRFHHQLACLLSRPFLYQPTHHRPGWRSLESSLRLKRRRRAPVETLRMDRTVRRQLKKKSTMASLRSNAGRMLLRQTAISRNTSWCTEWRFLLWTSETK